MNFYKYNLTENILLIGEGNFSFSVSFVKYLETENSWNERKYKIYSTCFEEISNSEECEKNVEFLRKNNVIVYFGVDATQLSTNKTLSGLKFNKIIFNFPHVGGKMKINLNRKLLRDFFNSTTAVLSDNNDTSIVVALCAGQGGIKIDTVQRKWEDTWQIVEMAAESNYILCATEIFSQQMLTAYKSIGFRGQNKSFNTNNALVYLFKRCEMFTMNLFEENLNTFLNKKTISHNNEEIDVSEIHYEMYSRKPFENSNSLFHLILNLTRKSFTSMDNNLNIIANLPLYTVEKSSYSPSCYVNNKEFYLRHQLTDAIKLVNYQTDIGHLFYGIIFNKLTNNFTVSPAACEIVIISKFYKVVVCNLISAVKEKFNLNGDFKWIANVSDDTLFYEDNYLNTKLFRNENMAIIDVDKFCSCLFNLESWKQLWNMNFKMTNIDNSRIILPCIFPCTFIFDISFAVENFNEEKFLNILWSVGAEHIDSVNLLNIYQRPDSERKSYCYRINYCCYKYAMTRKKTIEFQNDVIGKIVSLGLNATIS